ncbi:MAG TPA: RidA family protein [Saprospiraceae bacterium]|nr:RidA family protein [Saprospiraceae bacterium]
MISKKLLEYGYDYKPAKKHVPEFPFHSAVLSGNLIYTSGQIPLLGEISIKGKVGLDLDVDQAKIAAEICAFNCICAAGSIIDINSIVKVVKIFGMVNCAPGFNQTSQVINGSSEFFIKIFGENGYHARSAVGMLLPSDWAVEVEVIFEIKK